MLANAPESDRRILLESRVGQKCMDCGYQYSENNLCGVETGRPVVLNASDGSLRFCATCAFYYGRCRVKGRLGVTLDKYMAPLREKDADEYDREMNSWSDRRYIVVVTP